jgi:hypothetical protein
MPLPVLSIRARPEHRPLLQAVADLLRQGREDAVRRWVKEPAVDPVGPFRSEEAALGFLVDRLVAALRPRAVWLFGSRARNDHRPDSDFDLLVVLPDGLEPAAYAPSTAAAPLVACGLPFDVAACSWSIFEAQRRMPGSFVARITAEGRPLYQDYDLRAGAAAA